MSDETVGAPSPEDTQPTSPVADSTGTPAGEDWESRYKELQSTFTRTSQEKAQYEQIVQALSNPETATEALSALGYQFDTPEEPQPQYADPYEAKLAEIERQNQEMQKQLQQFAQQQQQAQVEREREQHFLTEQARLEQQHGRQFSDVEIDTLFRLADTMPDNGKPNVQAAYDLLYTKLADHLRTSVPAAPPAPLPGQPGAPAPDLTTQEGRLAHALSLAEAQQQQ